MPHDVVCLFQISGWFSGLLSKVMPRGPNEMILPDDTKKSVREMLQLATCWLKVVCLRNFMILNNRK